MAFEDGADYAVEIHADGQYSPNDITKAKQQLLENYDLIIGSRFQNKNPFLKDGMPFLRYFTNKITSVMTNLLCGIKLTEFHTGYKIFSKNLCKTVPYQENSNNYLRHPQRSRIFDEYYKDIIINFLRYIGSFFCLELC